MRFTLILIFSIISFIVASHVIDIQTRNDVTKIPVSIKSTPINIEQLVINKSISVVPDIFLDNPKETPYLFEGKRDSIKVPDDITREQAELLLYAYMVAKKDGHRDPSVLQGIIWQESRAGGYPGYEVAGDEFGLPVGKRYYGVAQIKVAAARDVFKRFPKDFPEVNWKRTTDEEIIVLLITDKKFNIRVASKYLWMLGHNERKKYKRPTNFAITAYNRGIGNARKIDYNKWHYTVAVNRYRRGFISHFNKENDLQ